MISLNEIKTLLKQVEINYRYRNNSLIKDTLDFFMDFAVLNHDDKITKKLWCLKQILFIQKKYIGAFFDIKKIVFTKLGVH